jgi:hypothetical protein
MLSSHQRLGSSLTISETKLFTHFAFLDLLGRGVLGYVHIGVIIFIVVYLYCKGDFFYLWKSICFIVP